MKDDSKWSTWHFRYIIHVLQLPNFELIRGFLFVINCSFLGYVCVLHIASIFLIFQKLDNDKNGVIEVKDLVGVYDGTKHPDVINGRRTNEEVFESPKNVNASFFIFILVRCSALFCYLFLLICIIFDFNLYLFG